MLRLDFFHGAVLLLKVLQSWLRVFGNQLTQKDVSDLQIFVILTAISSLRTMLMSFICVSYDTEIAMSSSVLKLAFFGLVKA